MATQQTSQPGPKTAFGRYMVYKFIPQYSNNVQGAVYIGAAILIIIVGLRGLGKVAGTIAIVPKFLIHDNSIDPLYVIGALFLEFFMLLLLAVVTFFTPEDMHGPSHGTAQSSGPSAAFKQELEQLKHLTDEEIKMIDSYVEKFGIITKKINKIQSETVQALTDIKASIK